MEYLVEKTRRTCSCCGKEFDAFITCPNGHFICDSCHDRQAIQLTKDMCSASNSSNPVEIFEEINKSPTIPMLGCHHAFMVAGAFITAIKNEGSIYVSISMIEEIYHRTQQQAIGGYCGLTGVCGIAPAMGACFAAISGAKCGMDSEQKLTMTAVSEIMQNIAELTGPSCCKAYARRSLEVSQNFLEKHMGIHLSKTTNKPICKHSKKHPHGCRAEKCPYYG